MYLCEEECFIFYSWWICAHALKCISSSAMTHLLRISSEHGVYGFDPLEQVGWNHVRGSAMWQNTACFTLISQHRAAGMKYFSTGFWIIAENKQAFFFNSGGIRAFKKLIKKRETLQPVLVPKVRHKLLVTSAECRFLVRPHHATTFEKELRQGRAAGERGINMSKHIPGGHQTSF